MKSFIIGVIITLLLTPVTVVTMGGYLDFENEGSNQICPPKDETAPVSTLVVTPTIVIWPENIYWLPTINLFWNGTDDPSGSGIQYFDIQYKAKYIGSNYHSMVIPFWRDWQMNTTNTSALFEPARDYIYYFRCRAVDNANNIEPWPATWDSMCVVISVPFWVTEEIGERVHKWVESIDIPEHYREQIREELPLPEEDEIPPVSRVEPLFPIHLWLSSRCWIQEQIVTIQVYPYPPAYYVYGWLREQGIISDGYSSASIPVSWTGFDNENMNRSGIKCYDVQYRSPIDDNWYFSSIKYNNDFAPHNPMEWKNWQSNTTETDSIFYTDTQGYYQFRCRATDNSDNVEKYPISADTSVFVIDLRITDTY
jgi:hypothetical protein